MRIEPNSRTWNIFGLLLFAGMAAAILWDVLPWFLAPIAPDAMPFYPFGYRTVTLDNLLAAGAEFTPQHLYWLVFHPLLANKLNYLVDTLLLVLAGVYYLRGRGTSLAAAWIGGLALGFSGYSFTLISAGHRGYFDMMACTVFAFGLLVRCFQGRHWFHFVMLGACIAWGVPYQPDVLVMVVALAGAYTLWLTFAPGIESRTPWQRMAQVYPRFLISLTVAAAIGGSGLLNTLEHQIADRQQQIAGVTSAAAGKDAAADPTAKKEDQWFFATNWSLPPEDVAEFVVPGIFGNDSFQQPYPYWGRLGQPHDWQPGQRSMPNYRQHTVYLGVLSICFALFAGMLWWRTRRGTLADVPFWFGAGVVCLLLAMGRYTPFYHLFYAIPYMDLVRCPVKFHHLVEICSAFLCGLGVEMWWRGAVVAGPPSVVEPVRQRVPRKERKNAAPAQSGGQQQSGAAAVELPAVAVVGRRMTYLAVALAGALLVAAGFVVASGVEIAAHIDQVGLRMFGLKVFGEELVSYAATNLVRAASVFIVAALLFGLGRPRVGRSQPAVWLLAVLALVLAVDLTSVAQRYVRPFDAHPFYASHVVADTLLARGGVGVGVANYTSSNNYNSDWFSSSLYRQGVRLSLYADPGSTGASVVQAAGNRPEVLWREMHARFVLAQWKDAASLVKAQVLTPVLSFAVGQGSVRQTQPAEDAFVLATFANAMPPSYVVDGWQGGLRTEEQLQRMRAADWDPARVTLCDAPGATNGTGRVIGRAQVTQARGWDFHLTASLAVDTPQAGLLVLDEKYAENLQVRVDGQEVPVHCANALWAAVEVPAGQHTVTVRQRPRALPLLLSAGVGLAVGLWGLWRLLRASPAGRS